MKQLKDLIRSTGLLKSTIALVDAQNELLKAQDKEIAQWKRLAFVNARAVRDLALTFRVAVEQPEVDVREELDRIAEKYSDQLARLEEHFL